MRKSRLQASCGALVTPFVHMRVMLTEADWLLHRVLVSLLQVWLNVSYPDLLSPHILWVPSDPAPEQCGLG